MYSPKKRERVITIKDIVKEENVSLQEKRKRKSIVSTRVERTSVTSRGVTLASLVLAPNQSKPPLPLVPRSYFSDSRFVDDMTKFSVVVEETKEWRTQKMRVTKGGVLAVCLNIGVNPPDVVKTSPCAKLECWIDPFSMPSKTALVKIGNTLSEQYKTLNQSGVLLQCLDPTREQIQRDCEKLRLQAKSERILFHYNGHGVPRPTTNGEVWVFNKTYTQYIPLSLFKLQNWIKLPAVYVLDCSSAGVAADWFINFYTERNKGVEWDPTDFVLISACAADETLPMNPKLPADILTSCLTDPLKMSLKWFCLQPMIVKNVTSEMIDKIPGSITDRNSALGELNWIFIAITESIAWSMLPKVLFRKLFRTDRLVSSLMRNYLLAERILHTCNCSPSCHPSLPQMDHHPLWQVWDMAVESCLIQLPDVINNKKKYKSGGFVDEQLTAFELSLDFLSESKASQPLPILLQIMLMQAHRPKVIPLLAKYVDCGPWAVKQIMGVGIFPYMVKLIERSEGLDESLAFIWAKIITLDQSCCADLLKFGCHKFFLKCLVTPNMDNFYKALAAFVLTAVVSYSQESKLHLLKMNIIDICGHLLDETDELLRRWVCLLLGKLWENCFSAKVIAVRASIVEKLCSLLANPFCEVRAASVFALGTFVEVGESVDKEDSHFKRIQQVQLNLVITFPDVVIDASPLVRRELAVTLLGLAKIYKEECKKVIYKIKEEEALKEEARQKKKMRRQSSRSIFKFVSSSSAEAMPPFSSSDEKDEEDEVAIAGVADEPLGWVYEKLWRMVLFLANDPFPEVCRAASFVVSQFCVDDAYDEPETTEIPEKNGFLSNLLGGLTNKDKNDDEQTENGDYYVTEPVTPEVDERIESMILPYSFNHIKRPGLLREQVHNIGEDQTSSDYIEKLWCIEKLKTLKEAAKVSSFKELNKQAAWIKNQTSVVSSLVFHPLEDIIVVGDEDGLISVWNWREAQKNEAAKAVFNGSEITAMKAPVSSLTFIDPTFNTKLMSVNEKGVVSIWGNIDDDSRNLLTSWRALPESTVTHDSSGLVKTKWIETLGVLIVGYDKTLRVWDAEKELSIQKALTSSDNPITAIETYWNELFVGYTDGTIKIFDSRCGLYEEIISFKNNDDHISNICYSFYKKEYIISGTNTGKFSFWDLRKACPCKNEDTNFKNLSIFTVHNCLPLIACGFSNQRIRILDLNCNVKNQIVHHEDFLGTRIGPVSALAFHPCNAILANGGTDSIVSVYTT